MRKLLIAITLLTSTSIANAQTRIGLEVGLNSSNALLELGSTKLDTKSLLGFNAGVNAEMHLMKQLYFQPGLHVETKGYKLSTSSTTLGITTTTESKATPMLVSIPLNLVYKFNLGSGKLFVLAGPYVSYGFAGKYKNDVTVAGNTTSTTSDIKFGTDSTKHTMKPLDLGLNLGLGYEYKNLFVKAQYGLGLSDLSMNTGNNFNNRVLSLSLGYWFGSSKKK